MNLTTQQQLKNMEVNRWLLATRKLSDSYRSQGKTEEANLLLKIGGDLALADLKIHGIIEVYSKVHCSFCQRQLINGKEVEFYNHVGLCHSCEKARIDADQDLIGVTI